MSYLLDTNVVSELRRARAGRCDPRVLRWVSDIEPPTLFISVVTAYELERGALLIGRHDADQGTNLRRWLDRQLAEAFRGRVLPVDLEVALRCATLSVPDPRPLTDALIAATALVHGMTVVTRNARHFERTGVALLNPWDG